MAGVYIGGKKIVPAQEKFSRIYFIEGLLGYLFYDLREFKVAIEAEDAKKPVQMQLRKLVLDYCWEILVCLDGYPTSSGRVTKRGRELVKKLRSDMLQFDADYSALHSKTRIPQKIHTIICELNWAVLWFIREHDMTIAAIKVTNPVPDKLSGADLLDFMKKEKIALKATKSSAKVLPHRPRDWEMRRYFKRVTSVFKKKNGVSKFIPYASFCRLLVAHNKKSGAKLRISVRGYYNLKQAWENGSLDRLV
jgi:hypothetical protein